MPDQMTTTGSFGAGRKEPMTAREDAIEALRQALLDEGVDPGTVEGMLHMVKPNETNIVGNYADLQRMGAIAQTGVMPTPPGEEDVETTDIEDAFIEMPVAVDADDADGEGKAPDVGEVAGDGDYESYTKAELQAELDAKGVEYNASDTKSELLDRLAE